MMDKSDLSRSLQKGLSIRQIAAENSLSYTAVRYWIRVHGLTTVRGPNGRKPASLIRCRACGESDPTRFYGKKTTICGRCHNRYTISKGKEARDYVLEKLGRKCRACEYDRFESALDCHHMDPTSKDPAFASMRGWSKARLDSEISKCILLCKNCHAAVHSGELSLREVA